MSSLIIYNNLLQSGSGEVPPDDTLPRRNSRNGFSKKTVQADFGQVELQIPRDRLSEFEPIWVKKGQRRLAGLDEKIIALYDLAPARSLNPVTI